MSKSVISNEKKCLVCDTTLDLHKHHIFYGSNRQNSEKYGCWCYLCAKHHNMSNAGVHFDPVFDRRLKEVCQMQLGWSQEEFIRVFGRSYI